MHRRGFVLLAAGATARAFQATKDSAAEADRKTDMYAIYSRVMENPVTSHGPGGNDILLIRDKTVPGRPRVPCVAPPRGSPLQNDFAEVLADYYARETEVVGLEYRLKVSKNYLILNDTESAEFERSREPYPGRKEERPPRFRSSTDLFGLIGVYFNPKRTLALTGLSSWCGWVCGGYSWMVFAKTGDTWGQLPWDACRVVASDVAQVSLNSFS